MHHIEIHDIWEEVKFRVDFEDEDGRTGVFVSRNGEKKSIRYGNLKVLSDLIAAAKAFEECFDPHTCHHSQHFQDLDND